MANSDVTKGAIAATIHQLKAREESQRLDSKSSYWAKVSNSESSATCAEVGNESPVETLLALKVFVPQENLVSYLNFVSYLGRREEEDVFVRLVHFLAIHTKIGQRLPGEIHKAGEDIIRNIHQAMAHDVGSWKEEHDSLNRIKHEFQGSLGSMLKEHREAHQKHLTFLMDAVIKTVTQLEENQRILSEGFQTVINQTPKVGSKVNDELCIIRSHGQLILHLGILMLGVALGVLGCCLLG